MSALETNGMSVDFALSKTLTYEETEALRGLHPAQLATTCMAPSEWVIRIHVKIVIWDFISSSFRGE